MLDQTFPKFAPSHIRLSTPSLGGWLPACYSGALFDPQVSLREICGGQTGNNTEFSPCTPVFPSQFHSTSVPQLFIFIYVFLLPEGHKSET